jgi:hypothetical protein
MKYRGSCHCGQVAFEAEGEIGEVLSCNCSICQRKGSLLWFIPREQLRLLNAPEAMHTYTFNQHVIKHHFCPVCGLQPFGEGSGPDGRAMAAINVRCLEGVEPESFKVQHYNGRDL